MKFTVVTLFPQMIEAFTHQGLIGQAHTRGQIEIHTLNPRQFTSDVHHTVDDKAFGGGDGMVMKVEPLAAAIESLKQSGPLHVAVLSPQGRRWDQSLASAWAKRGGHVALVCGRYAGIDQRFVNAFADEEISLGDFILNGGEVAACAVIESVSRLLPGVLGNQISSIQDSFTEGLLECPQFTRPREILQQPVPSPLLSGNHAQIARFQRAVALVRTAILRPDLLKNPAELSKALGEIESLPEAEINSLGLTRQELQTCRANTPR